MNEGEEKSDTIREQVVVRKLGYLRIPNAVRQKYGSFVDVPEPDDVEVTDHEGRLTICYVWEIRNLMKKGGE